MDRQTPKPVAKTMKRNLSTNGAPSDSPGHRPGLGLFGDPALKGRNHRCAALSGLGICGDAGPRALPWAKVFCSLGAEEMSRKAKRAVLEKQVNANLEGLGYGRKQVFSTNGAPSDSLGHRPGLGLYGHSALKGRNNRCAALSGLGIRGDTGPRVSPRAIPSCPLGAEEKRRTAKRAVLEKQVNANLEGMGHGG